MRENETEQRENRGEEGNVHAGHRARLFEAYARAGLDGFSDVVVLELLLTFAIPRKNTNPLAHRLLKTFGTLHGVLSASEPQLRAVPGMPPRAAALVGMLRQLWQRAEASRAAEELPLRADSECVALLRQKFVGAQEEQVWILCMDAKCKLLDCCQISEGSVNYTAMPLRRVVEAALAAGATAVMLAHNHTSGVALPSREDVALTRKVKTALENVDVVLLDHIVVAENDYVSMRESGLL